LGPVVALKADVSSQEDKEDLSKAIFYLGQPSTGSIKGDILKLSEMINEYVVAPALSVAHF
jgi:hypothetical protein